MFRIFSKSIAKFCSQNISELQMNPLYNKAIKSLFSNQFNDAEKNLTQLKSEIKDISQQQEILDLFVQLYQTQGLSSKLISTQEEAFFSYLSSNSIYNDENQTKLEELLKSYFTHDIKRGLAFMQFIYDLFDNQIPFVYQKQCLTYGAIFDILNKDYNAANEKLTKSLDMGLQDRLLGVCLNNLAISKSLNLESEMQKTQFGDFCEQNIKLLIQSIIALEVAATEDLQSQKLVYLYQLVEQSENGIQPKTINQIIDQVMINHSDTYKVIMNLIDLYINNNQKDKASAWIKLLFNNKTKQLNKEIEGFGRSMLQLAKISMLTEKYRFSEKLIIDFLESNVNRKSFLQMLGLVQYSMQMKLENRIFEAEEYEKQAINISEQIDPVAYVREQLLFI